MRLRSVILFALSAAIIAIVLWKADVGQAAKIILKADPFYVGLGFACILADWCLKVVRWKMLVGVFKKRISLFRLVSSCMASMFLANVTPARFGDVSRPYFLKGHGVPFSALLSSVVIERVIDLAVLLIFSVLFMVFFAFYVPGYVSIALAMMFFLLSGLLALLFNKRLMLRTVNFLGRTLRLKRFSKNLRKTVEEFYAGISHYNLYALTRVTAVTIVIWLVDFLLIYFSALSLGQTVPFMFCIGFFAIAQLVGVLSCLPGGLGSMEAVLVAFFITIRISAPLALSITLLSRFLSLGASAIVGAAFFIREIKR